MRLASLGAVCLVLQVMLMCGNICGAVLIPIFEAISKVSVCKNYSISSIIYVSIFCLTNALGVLERRRSRSRLRAILCRRNLFGGFDFISNLVLQPFGEAQQAARGLPKVVGNERAGGKKHKQTENMPTNYIRQEEEDSHCCRLTGSLWYLKT